MNKEQDRCWYIVKSMLLMVPFFCMAVLATIARAKNHPLELLLTLTAVFIAIGYGSVIVVMGVSKNVEELIKKEKRTTDGSD